MSRSHKGSSGGDTIFIVIILLAGTIWTQRALIFKVLLVVCIIAVVSALIKILYRVKVWRRLNNPTVKTIDRMNGLEFEKYVARLLKHHGYSNIKLTEKYDLGVDIIAHKNGVIWGIQAKRHSSLVKALAVRQAVTALRKYKCDRAMVVTNNRFSRTARELADSNECVLIDRSRLLHLIQKE